MSVGGVNWFALHVLEFWKSKTFEEWKREFYKRQKLYDKLRGYKITKDVTEIMNKIDLD